MQKLKAIIIDLDGTLANITHRRHHVEGKIKNWPAFMAGIPDDSLNIWCKQIIDRFKKDFKIIIVTGRMVTEEKNTLDWLKKHSIHFDQIHFRKKNDFRGDDEVKEEIYNHSLKNEFEIFFVVDDRKRVVEMWRRIGLVCLQCDEGDF